MPYLVRLADRALRDMEAIYKFIHAEASESAFAWFNALAREIHSLERFPERGAVIPESKKLRHLLFGRKGSTCRIIYALINRLKRGAIYKPEMVQKALTGFFKGSNLGALRELALRQAAHEVDLRQSAYDESSAYQLPRISEARQGGVVDNQPKEHILLHITVEPSTAMLIRRGRRVADYLQGNCTALFVRRTAQLAELPPDERGAVEKHLRFARSLQIETRVISAPDIAEGRCGIRSAKQGHADFCRAIANDPSRAPSPQEFCGKHCAIGPGPLSR